MLVLVFVIDLTTLMGLQVEHLRLTTLTLILGSVVLDIMSFSAPVHCIQFPLMFAFYSP